MNYKNFLIVLFILLMVSVTLVQAEEKYSFEKSERMKPLIKWRDYGPEAFKEAQESRKPIFLLLTAPSWCYWCQVYESEDYLFNPQVIQLINEKFIPIYVDADRRQDITRKYLEGGWPSTTILTPENERIFGYSGPRPVSNMIANLNNAVQHVNNNKGSVEINYNYEKDIAVDINENLLRNVLNNYLSTVLRVYDPEYGGFGFGQKFPQGRTLDFALEIYEKSGDKKWLDLVKNTLENQYTKIEELETNYNLFDPVEGGFHRYGTTREWTPPHYEKMLYDNARLLKAYFHLQQIEDGKIVNEVVTKTNEFMKREWYDSKRGGFYGNSDVHGEDNYYGKNPRHDVKPRVEKTKYTDWNSEAILTYLYLYEKTENSEYKDMTVKSLDFFEKNMYDENGAYHYYKDGEKGVQGNLLDNSYLLLAFVEGYRVLGDEKYLKAAEELAGFSLDNLYDWNSGGFFERNSKATDIYAPGENIDLSKPGEENGVMAYAFLKLYQQTQESKYLNAGIKTLGVKLSDSGGLDNGYYFIKASEIVLNNNLLNKYSEIRKEVIKIENEKQKTFWVNDLIKKSNIKGSTGFVVSDEGLDKFKGSLIVLIFIALIAGFISFASPCTLPILPAFVAFSFRNSGKNIKGMTISFFIGLSIIFVILGMTASFIGGWLRSYVGVFSQIAGIVIILLGLSMLFGKGFSGLQIKQKPRSYLGSFMFGGVFGLAWTPCVGPILVAILVLASATGSTVTGGMLLFSYAVGLAFPLIIVSSYLDRINKNSRLWRLIRGKMIIFELGENKEFRIHSNSLISGLLFIILGWLIFSGALFSFNQYFATTSFQKWIFAMEDKLLGFAS